MQIAVLGGGMGGLTAAWDLARQGHKVTVYQRGWRLGGKGASGRNAGASERIEEHGLHVLMGFYDQTFALLRDVYAEAHKVGAVAGGAPLPWVEAFSGWNTCVFSRQTQAGTWSFFAVEFPSKPATTPWDGPRPGADFVALFKAGVQVLEQISSALKVVFPNKLLDLAFDAAIAGLLTVVGALNDAARLAALATLQQTLTVVIKAAVAAGSLKSARAEWLFIGFCFAAGNALGMLRDKLLTPAPDFASIDGIDYREWLGSALDPSGCPSWASRDSPFVTALYDLAFSRTRTLAAGVTLKVLLRMGLDYRGDVAFKMNAGMGDIIFAPLYRALTNLGVQFRFFHRVTAVTLDATKRYVEAIEFERQVATPGGYDPLVDVKGLACWPHEPRTALLAAAYQTAYTANGGMPYDFEHAAGPSPFRMDAMPFPVHRGPGATQFEAVVLAIPVGALGGICADLVAADQGFAAMVQGLTTIRTAALQVWTAVPYAQLKSPAKRGMVISYRAPFNSWADMSQVLAREAWPVAPQGLAYFCDALPDAVPDAAATAWVAAEGEKWLQGGVADLWPGYAHPGDTIAMYPRANVEASARYVLSEKGTVSARRAPEGSGFTNLALAGDWVATDLNSGCLEAATLGGLGAADAIRTGKITH